MSENHHYNYQDVGSSTAADVDGLIKSMSYMISEASTVNKDYLSSSYNLSYSTSNVKSNASNFTLHTHTNHHQQQQLQQLRATLPGSNDDDPYLGVLHEHMLAIGNIRDESNKMEEKMSQYKEQIKIKQHENDELHDRNSEILRKNELLSSRIDELEQLLSDRQLLEIHMQELISDKNDMSQQLTLEKEKYSALHTSHTSQHSEISSLKLKLLTVTDYKELYELHCQQNLDTDQRQKETINAKESIIDDLTRKISSITDDNDRLKQSLHECQSKLSTSESSSKQYEKLHVDSFNAMKQQQEVIQNLHNEYAQLQQTYDRSLAASSKHKKKHEDCIQQANSEILHMKKQVASAMESADSWKVKYNDLTQLLGIVVSEISDIPINSSTISDGNTGSSRRVSSSSSNVSSRLYCSNDMRVLCNAFARQLHSSSSDKNRGKMSCPMELKCIMEFIIHLTDDMKSHELEAAMLADELSHSTNIIDNASTVLQKMESKLVATATELDTYDSMIVSVLHQASQLVKQLQLLQESNGYGYDTISFDDSSINMIDVSIDKDFWSTTSNTHKQQQQQQLGKSILKHDRSRNINRLHAYYATLQAYVGNIDKEMRKLNRDNQSLHASIAAYEEQLKSTARLSELQSTELKQLHERELRHVFEQFNSQMERMRILHNDALEGGKRSEDEADIRVRIATLEQRTEYESRIDELTVQIATMELDRADNQEKMNDVTTCLEYTMHYLLKLEGKHANMLLQKRILSSLCLGYESICKGIVLLSDDINSSIDRVDDEYGDDTCNYRSKVVERKRAPKLKVVVICVLSALRLRRILQESHHHHANAFGSIYSYSGSVHNQMPLKMSFSDHHQSSAWMLPTSLQIQDMRSSPDALVAHLMGAASEKTGVYYGAYSSQSHTLLNKIKKKSKSSDDDNMHNVGIFHLCKLLNIRNKFDTLQSLLTATRRKREKLSKLLHNKDAVIQELGETLKSSNGMWITPRITYNTDSDTDTD